MLAVGRSIAPVSLGEGSTNKPHLTRVARCLLERGHYSVRVVDSYAVRNDAVMLIQRLYASRGYRTESVELLLHNRHQITFVALSAGRLFGTLTLRFDSSEGLLADGLYKHQIDKFRKKGRNLCELCAFAVDPLYSSKDLLTSLFQIAYVCGRAICEAADAFIEVNPRHAGFYKRTLCFRELGPARICPRVNAPAVLLHLDLDYMDMQLKKNSGLLGSTENSIHLYSTAGCHAKCLVHRIAQVDRSCQ